MPEEDKRKEEIEALIREETGKRAKGHSQSAGKVVLRRIGVLSAAKIYAFISVVFGLIIGIFFALFSVTLGDAFGTAGIGAGLGALAIIAFPIIFGIIGFLIGAFGALLYNFSAKWIGGLEVEIER